MASLIHKPTGHYVKGEMFIPGRTDMLFALLEPLQGYRLTYQSTTEIHFVYDAGGFGGPEKVRVRLWSWVIVVQKGGRFLVTVYSDSETNYYFQLADH